MITLAKCMGGGGGGGGRDQTCVKPFSQDRGVQQSFWGGGYLTVGGRVKWERVTVEEEGRLDCFSLFFLLEI